MLKNSGKQLDEQFTRFADAVTYFIGKWWFTVISLLILIAWIAYGIIEIPNWFTSPVWNFPANSVTTLGEWFMAGLTLAAANRVERRNETLLQHIKEHAERDVHTTQEVQSDVEQVKRAVVNEKKETDERSPL